MNITFLIQQMAGGGAERVISLLSSTFAETENVSIILTHQSLADAVFHKIDSRVKIISLEDELKKTNKSEYAPAIIMLYARLIGKLKKKSDCSSVLKYLSRNYDRVRWLKRYFSKQEKPVAVSFLYSTIFISLLAESKIDKLIISERGDPCRSLSSKTDVAFFRTMFHKADEVVFQSPDVKKWYNENTNVKGITVFNPIKSDLPLPYDGVRQKKIVNFCRISTQKNLILLVEAFSLLNKDYPDYELYIYGNEAGNGAEGYLDSLNQDIEKKELTAKIHILPGRSDIHSVILDYAMFVSSSDFEGMSNSMLEAMAIGLPTVCTDCPAGGARAVIKDHENGILTPVGDAKALYLAMKEVIENPELAKMLSENGRKIRETQSVEKIVAQWREIIDA